MYYYNGIGRRLYVPELPLEPRDCWDDSDYVPAEDPFEEEISEAVNEVV